MKKPKGTGPGWPSFPVKPTLPGLLDSLKTSQWWPERDLADAQQPQLAWLLNWAAVQVPYYESSGWTRAAARSLTEHLTIDPQRFSDLWRSLPLLTKPDLRTQGAQLNARSLPAGQAPISTLRTSGSTGI
ncbi:MAG: hypothetical protein Q8N51_04485, partial [Gammaproteobacteria bacterium]|nr:hypothetical protein [Gammaproteobacteria bacterium]